MKALRLAEETAVDWGKLEETNTMANEGETSQEWLMEHAAAAGSDEDERDKGERD